MAYRALCRILQARTGVGGIAFYERAEGRFLRRHATEDFLTMAAGASEALEWAPPVPEVQQVPPESFGLRAAMCLVQPFGMAEDGASGLVIVASRRPRLPAARLAAALRDVADVAAHLPPHGARIGPPEPDAHVALLDRSRLDLRHALASGELSLVYQPYVDLTTGQKSGVEALMRWRHPTRGEIAPATFIPLAEATGQILPIGMWALGTACAEVAGWAGDFTLSVNVSPLQFHAPDFVAEVEAVLAGTGFPAERLELEITETVVMRDNLQVFAQLRALVALGVRIALDDFGTGYSALAYLSRLPHHRIKLDKTFVQDMGRPSTAALIRAIVRLARVGGVAITAEGIEHPDQLRAAKAMGFTHAQGFATGLPLPGPVGTQEPIRVI